MIVGVVALMLGSAMPAPAKAIEHRTQVAHPSGAIDARYRADVTIEHRQIGAVGAGGRPSTLRCLWRAALVVDRHATHGSGSTLSRSFTHDAVAEGSRPGWCSAQRGAIAQEVAGRSDAMRDRLIEVAQDDHPVLHAEIDRLPGSAQTG